MALPSRTSEYALLRWANAALEEGLSYLEHQDGYHLIQPTLDRITSKTQLAILQDLEKPTGMATTTSNRFGKIAKELVAGMTDIKPFWVIKTYNPRFQHQAEIFSKLSEWWYTSTNADQVGLANCLRYAVCAGSSFIHLQYDPVRDEIIASAEDPRDVIPIRPSDNISIQSAYGVIVRRERSVNYVKDLFPNKADLITADRGSFDSGPLENTKYGRYLAEINSRTQSPIKDALFAKRPKTTIGHQPAVTLYTMYVRDDAKNDTSDPVEMGQWEDDPAWQKPEGIMGFFAKAPRRRCNNWSYLVQPGKPLYPRGRMVIFISNVVLYDGPNIYWHGEFPLIKLTLDPWPTTWLGLAPMWDLISLQDSLDWNLRVVDDHNAQVAQPPVIGDPLSVGPNGLASINTRKAGLQFMQNPMGKGLQFPGVPPLDNSIGDHIAWVAQEMDDLSGILDLKNLSGLNQLPSSETIEKMIESKSFLLQGRSRIIEAFMREFARMLLSNFAQFYTLKKRFTIGGPNFVTPEDFDFDPDSLIPAFTHSEDFDEVGNLKEFALERGPMPREDRAKELLRQLSYYIAPGSLLAASGITRKLLYLQLFREGALDIWTLAEQLDISGFGEPPAGANTIIERLMAQQQMGLAFGGGGGGAPPSGQAPPSFGNNGSGTVIRES